MSQSHPTSFKELYPARKAHFGLELALILTTALIESFRLNLGPAQLLAICPLNFSLMASLRGNSNANILKLILAGHDVDPSITDMRKIVQSLLQNQGLEELDFGQHDICDENWSMLRRSIAS
jgi:hypothetical protein